MLSARKVTNPSSVIPLFSDLAGMPIDQLKFFFESCLTGLFVPSVDKPLCHVIDALGLSVREVVQVSANGKLRPKLVPIVFQWSAARRRLNRSVGRTRSSHISSSWKTLKQGFCGVRYG